MESEETETEMSLLERLSAEMDMLERHVLMLRTLRESQPMGIIRLSEQLGLPNHKVRYSLRLLEREGLIIPSADGAMITDEYDEFLSQLDAFLERLSRRAEALRESLADRA